jgi:uncharacterized membrane protein
MGDEHDTKKTLPQSINENIATIAEFYERHEQSVSLPQKVIEKLSVFLGSPGYIASSVVFVLCWIAANLVAPEYGYRQVDPPPFSWLQGIITFNAFIISTTVLIRQNRMTKLAEHHSHLDLQVNMLTEEKTSKIIALLEELRRDMPDVSNKIDPEADELAQPADTKTVLSAIESERE